MHAAFSMHSQRPQSFSIEPLFRHSHHAKTLARWHFDEWRHLYHNWSLAVAHDELQQHGAAIPATLIALDDDEVE